MRRSLSVLIMAAGLVVAALPLAQMVPLGLGQRPAGATVAPQYGQLPLSFIENRGQADDSVAYSVQGTGTSMAFTAEGPIYSFDKPGSAVRVNFAGGRVAKPVGEAPLPGKVSYFKGDQATWKTGVPTFGRVVYREVWPGIDVVYQDDGSHLKSEYRVAPGADPAQVRLAYQGADDVTLSPSGELIVSTPAGSFTEQAPLTYQDIDGGREVVDSAYVRLPGDDPTFGFRLGAYRSDRPLVIDPVTIVYAGYVGSNFTDVGRAIAVDNTGAAYLAGSTTGNESVFPVTAGAFDTTYGGGTDGFVAKISPDGSTLVYLAYLGGSALDHGRGIAVDSTGAAYVAGMATSPATGFPVLGPTGPTANGSTLGSAPNGNTDMTITKILPNGSGLVYSGFIGSTFMDNTRGLAVDSAGAAYLVGTHTCTSTDCSFPTVVGPDLTFNSCSGCGADVVVSKVRPDGSGLAYSGYLGGTGVDEATGIAVDSTGAAYVSGRTQQVPGPASGFPALVGPDLTHAGGTGAEGFHDAFITKIKPDGTGFVYSGFIGGSGDEYTLDTDVGNAIAVDSTGAAYLTGQTTSTESSTIPFPLVGGPDLTGNGGIDGFLVKVRPDGTGFDYSGFIGGTGTDIGRSVAVDSSGAAYVTGQTASTESSFPVFDGPDLTANGGDDAFVTKVNPSGTAFVHSGFIGGTASDIGRGIVLDSVGDIYLTGQTNSSAASFPVLGGPDLTSNGGIDAFVAKLHNSEVDPVVPEVPWALALPLSSLLIFLGFVAGNSRHTADAG